MFNCSHSEYFFLVSRQNFWSNLCLLPLALSLCFSWREYLHLLYNYLLLIGRLWLHPTWAFSSWGRTNPISSHFFSMFSNLLITLLALCWTLSSFLMCLLSWPVFQPVTVSIHSDISFGCIYLSSKFHVICRLGEDAFTPIIQIILKDTE